MSADCECCGLPAAFCDCLGPPNRDHGRAIAERSQHSYFVAFALADRGDAKRAKAWGEAGRRLESILSKA